MNAPTRAGLTRSDVVAFAVFGLLLLVAAALLLKQNVFHPAVLARAGEGAAPEAGADAGHLLGGALPDALTVFSPAESFDAENLSDKIDGRAELYLSSGFESLVCQRLAPASAPGSWFEFYVYDMGAAEQAYAVYSGQKRTDAEALDWTPNAYATPDGFYFAQGPMYVEVIASDPQPAVLEGMRTASLAWLAEAAPAPAAAGDAPAPRWPAEGLDPSQEIFLLTDAFGSAELDRVYAVPSVGGDYFAFRSDRSSPEAAGALAQSYRAFLEVNGASFIEPPPIPGAYAADVYGYTEVVFTVGPALAGIHEAEDRAAAFAAALRLHEHLEEE